MVFVLDRLLRFGLKWSEKSLLAYLQGQIPNIKTTINPLFIHVLELTEWRSSFRIRTGILKFKNLKTLIPKAKKLNKKSDTVRIYAEFHCFRAIIKICCTLPEIVLIHSHKRVKKTYNCTFFSPLVASSSIGSWTRFAVLFSWFPFSLTR